MKKIFSLFAAALLIAACTPNEEVSTPFQAGQKVTLAASMGGNGAKQMPGQQRVAGVDNGSQIDLTWNAGDQITVNVGGSTAVFTLSSGAGSASATFTGTMPASGTTYQVSYPANYDESVLANQTYVENGFGNGLMKMSTKSAGTLDGGFVLSADNALLGLQLTGTQALSKIVLTNPAASTTYTLNCAGVTLSNTATLFYMVVPAVEWANGFTVEVYDAEGNVITSFTKSGAVTFSSTTSMIMPVKEVESVYEGIAFSISATKKVIFSPGNLQYTKSTNTWSFASAQYEMIGTDNVTGGSVSIDGKLGYKKSGTALADKIDLFGWSTSVTDFGVGIYEDDNNDYSGSFVDWGTNKIGEDAANTWRTLTYDEWSYLRKSRPNANDLVGVAQVNGVNGLIFLPDNWVCPPDVTFRSGFHSDEGADYFALYQIFNADQWANLESAGAVFLPAAGFRNPTYIAGNVYGLGNYWSAVKKDSESPYYFFFYSSRVEMGSYNRLLRQSVRLVKDLQ